ncbi:MAG: class I SAM-dependent methyltransferase family protein [Candidatus Methanogaster sp.]|uniref:Class I SAM-dependent methyltransferase family protein n=1 Tax=Candidatus Methanogaster sp. TaxID=3386292 RepID=A0AC61KXV4_9EURY|nr:MAG: class I SAM-dependent methyltransferase family protein [ANME-2 cluster archaeon]
MTPTKLRDLVHIPPNEAKLLPRGWQILGTVILVSIPDALRDHANAIGDALLAMYPRCSTVLRNRGVAGRFREPICEVIAGTGETETIHKENGCYFKLDAARIMFSQGNLVERMRMARICEDEVVLDMFAGIGYFSIQIAVHSRPKKVIAIELNPTAYHYLTENIRINRVGDLIFPGRGDCVVKAPENIADRVIMGYLDPSHEQIVKGLLAARSGGILHYHEATPTALAYHRPIHRIEDAAQACGRIYGCRRSVELIGCRTIKKYAPGVVHVVVDVRVT